MCGSTREWDKFLICLKWAADTPYPRHERPSLQVAYDLMDDYDRNEVRLRSRQRDLNTATEGPSKAVIPSLVIQPGEPLDLTPTTTVILGDGRA